MRKIKTTFQHKKGVFLFIICGLLAGLFTQCFAGGAKPPKMLKEFLDGPMASVDEIVFACRQLNYDGHWYANFGYYAENAERKAYRAMGRLCKLNLKTGEVTVLLDDPKGSVRDPQVHYDGDKILFSYRKNGTENYNLYEINSDGTALKQLTDGPYDDIEPTYLPDGSIVFCSSRCHRWVGCWLTHVAILYRCDADGSNIRPISSCTSAGSMSTEARSTITTSGQSIPTAQGR
jgi:Tol biopolymer transport system component